MKISYSMKSIKSTNQRQEELDEIEKEAILLNKLVGDLGITVEEQVKIIFTLGSTI